MIPRAQICSRTRPVSDRRPRPWQWVQAFLGSTILVVSAAGNGRLSAQGTADYMHRGHGPVVDDDALMSAFRSVVMDSRTGDWSAISRTIQGLDPQLDHYRTQFLVDVRSKLRRSTANQDAASTLRDMAEVVYLAMKEQFAAILQDNMANSLDAHTRFRRARLYYDRVLSGNIQRRNPERHTRIEGRFVLAEAALGNPSLFVDLPVMASDVRAFREATRAIEQDIQSVYTYFGQGQAG